MVVGGNINDGFEISIPVNMPPKRNKITYAILITVTIAAGLLSRKFSFYFPALINEYIGDALWAAMIFFIFAFIFNRKKTIWIAILSLAFCYLIELSQLYHAPWIDNIRATTIGALILGFGFLWSDLLAYFLGIVLGVITNMILQKRK